MSFVKDYFTVPSELNDGNYLDFYFGTISIAILNNWEIVSLGWILVKSQLLGSFLAREDVNLQYLLLCWLSFFPPSSIRPSARKAARPCIAYAPLGSCYHQIPRMRYVPIIASSSCGVNRLPSETAPVHHLLRE